MTVFTILAAMALALVAVAFAGFFWLVAKAIEYEDGREN